MGDVDEWGRLLALLLSLLLLLWLLEVLLLFSLLAPWRTLLREYEFELCLC